ncbi:hypothetical protein ACLIWF_18280 (plasmid) [Proteus mirabilis]
MFIRPRNAYLSTDKPKETFEWIENNWFRKILDETDH